MENDSKRISNEEKLNLKEVFRFEKYPRLDWLDQFRGIVVILLIISTVTWALSLNVEQELPPIGATYLNHGWKYYSYSEYGWPEIITIIDIGQQIFMFVVGFVAALSFLKRSEKENEIIAIKHAIRRYVALMALAIVDDGIIDNIDNLNLDNTGVLLIFILIIVSGIVLIMLSFVFDKKKKDQETALHNLLRNTPGVIILALIYGLAFANFFGGMQWGWTGMFWRGTLPNLAWGSIFAIIILKFTKEIPDKRFIIALVIMSIHSVLLSIPEVVAWRWMINDIEYFRVPFNTINHIAISVVGTCTYQWWMQKTDDDPEYGIKKRILPIAGFSFVACYLIDFFQPAEHRMVSTALVFMTFGTAMFVMYIFYNFEKSGFKVPMLTEFGKNMLMMFILMILISVYLDLDFVAHERLKGNPLYALIMVGIIPILLLYLIAWILAKKNIIIKF